MKAWRTLAEAAAPDGQKLLLVERDQEFVIKVGGQLLMSSRSHGSEEEMASAGLPAGRATGRARVLVGGLGCGYTVRAALDRIGPGATVTVAEISAAVIEWNRGPLAALARQPLADARVEVRCADVRAVLAEGVGRFDAILLDVDNGPAALTTKGNHALYQASGLTAGFAALRPRGHLVVWSAAPDPRFTTRLRAAGFAVDVRSVPARTGQRGGRHTLFVATRP